MNEFISKLNGFNPDYAKINNIKEEEEKQDEFDFSEVDFCQGEEITDNKINIFGSEQAENYKNYDNDESIFNFD